MLEDSVENNHKPRAFRFTIGTFLLGTTLTALFITVMIVQRNVRQLQQNGSPQKPFSISEIATSVENYASVHPKPVKVVDVQYSPRSDSYKVWFTFVDTTTGESLKTNVILNGDGYGSYIGCIKHDRFLAPLPNKDGLWLGIEPPMRTNSNSSTNQAVNPSRR